MQYASAYVRYLLKSCIARFVSPFMRWVHSRATRGTFDGIKIVNMDDDQQIIGAFRTDTIDALRLIKLHDPRRYRRVQKQIEYVLNNKAFGFGSYNPFQKVCQVDHRLFVDRLGYGGREWYLRQYATIIVREATSGVIHERRILYTVTTRERIERLRHIEQRRFAKRFDTEEQRWSETLVGEFDEYHWNNVWAETLWQRFKRMKAQWHAAQQNTIEADIQNRK